MIIYHEDGTVTFSIFSVFHELVCLFSTRKLGNLKVGKRPIENALPLLSIIPESTKKLVLMDQIHSGNVAKINKNYGGAIVSKVDGLITQDIEVYLGVNSADCVPIFYYDPVAKIIAIAHAGWRGPLAGIAKNIISYYKEFGSKIENIYVALGPHIGGCCYQVPYDRIKAFVDSYGSNEKAFFQSNDGWHLDLGFVNKQQLLSAGMLETNIDAPITCTSCQNNTYFSYRKDSKETFGEMLVVIGLRS